MRTALVLLSCLGLCSCALAPEWDDSFDQQYLAPVAPVVGHQQYATPVPPGSEFETLSWGISNHYIQGGASSPIPKMFAPPSPPFSY